MNISSTYDIDFTTESEMTTYNDILSCTFNIVQDPTYSSYYRIDGELHSVYSLDYDNTDGLVFVMHGGMIEIVTLDIYYLK